MSEIDESTRVAMDGDMLKAIMDMQNKYPKLNKLLILGQYGNGTFIVGDYESRQDVGKALISFGTKMLMGEPDRSHVVQLDKDTGEMTGFEDRSKPADKTNKTASTPSQSEQQ